MIKAHESDPRKALALEANDLLARTDPDLMNQLGQVRIIELLAEQTRREIVREAREAGMTWEEIGSYLGGITKQAVQKRYGN